MCRCQKYYDNNANICLDEIEEGYYYFNETINKCDEKCLICSLESISQNNSCISCNINKGFYPIFDKNRNSNLFIECYNNTPYGYYLENNSYVLDKRCDKFEDFNFNNTLNYTNFSYFYCPKYYYCDTSNKFYCTEECPSRLSKIYSK